MSFLSVTVKRGTPESKSVCVSAPSLDGRLLFYFWPHCGSLTRPTTPAMEAGSPNYGLLGNSLMLKSLKCHVCGCVLGTAEEDAGEGILSPGQPKIKHTPND